MGYRALKLWSIALICSVLAFTLGSIVIQNSKNTSKVSKLDIPQNINHILVNEEPHPVDGRFRVLVLQSYRRHIEPVLGAIDNIMNANIATEMIVSISPEASPFIQTRMSAWSITWNDNPKELVSLLEATTKFLDVDLLVLPSVEFALIPDIHIPRGLPNHTVVITGNHLPSNFGWMTKGIERVGPLVLKNRLKITCLSSFVTKIFVERLLPVFNESMKVWAEANSLGDNANFLKPDDFATWSAIWKVQKVGSSEMATQSSPLSPKNVTFIAMVNSKPKSRYVATLYQSLLRLREQISEQERKNNYLLRIILIADSWAYLWSFGALRRYWSDERMPSDIRSYFQIITAPDNFQFYQLHETAVGLLPLLEPGGIYFTRQVPSVNIISQSTHIPMIATEEHIQVYREFTEETVWLRKGEQEEGDVILSLLSDKEFFKKLELKRISLEKAGQRATQKNVNTLLKLLKS